MTKQQEQQLIKDYNSGKFTPENFDKPKYIALAKNSIRKNRSISIRLPEQDIIDLKVIAADKRLPYQTMIGIILHQVAQKKLEVTI